MTTFKEYQNIFKEELANWYDEKEIESFFYLILDHFHNKKRIDIALNPTLAIEEDFLEHWEFVLNELKKEKPLQYILGKTEFYGFPFLVSEATLIPRPETEELVHWIETDYQNKELHRTPRMLDIGTGSGCIAITLAKIIPYAQVYALDISKEALKIAKENSRINDVNISFLSQDILSISSLNSIDEFGKPFDCIVSNPPYVRNSEKIEIKKNVLAYEPHEALFVENTNPLVFYKKIGLLALESLTEKGSLYLEINQYLGKETVDLLKSIGFTTVQLRKDIFGNDRMIRCKKK